MIRVYLSSIYCGRESDEWSASDEPYVLVVAVDLAASVSVGPLSIPIPALDVFLYGPFEDMDAGETHAAPGIVQSFWGLSGAPVTITDPSTALFIVSMMEHDDGHPEALRTLVKAAAESSLLASLALAQPQRIAALIRDVNSALATPTGAPNFDNQIGFPLQLSFSPAEVASASSGNIVQKTLAFSGSSDSGEGSFTLTFAMRLDWRQWFQVSPSTVPSPGLIVSPLRPRKIDGDSTADHIDLFILNENGVWSTWWERLPGWQGWFQIPGSTFLPPGPVTALSPRTNHIDLFACDKEGEVWTTWWEPIPNWKSTWDPISPGRPRRGAGIPRPSKITALVPRADHIDLFLTDWAGIVWSTWWEFATGWQAWKPISPGPSFQPYAVVTAITPRVDHVDLFVTDANGVVLSTWWEFSAGWQPWNPISPGPRFQPGATVTALNPRKDHIDLFTVDPAGVVQSTFWEPAIGWQAWFPISSPGVSFRPGATVTAALRSHVDEDDSPPKQRPVWGGNDLFAGGMPIDDDAPPSFHIDIFVMDSNGKVVWTTSWEPATRWLPWTPVAPVPPFAAPAEVTALTPRDNHIDLFTVDSDSVWSTFWQG